MNGNSFPLPQLMEILGHLKECREFPPSEQEQVQSSSLFVSEKDTIELKKE